MVETEIIDTVDRGKNIFGTEGIATEYFPAKEYREGQRECIEEIEDAFQRFKYIVLEGPTGSGKSVIAATFARQSNDAYLLTVQKLLQLQYQRDFSDFFVMMGRSEYPCTFAMESEGLDYHCANGICKRKNIETKSHRCAYRNAKNRAMISPITILNFDGFYYMNTFGYGFSKRKLLICDECHNIPTKYLDFMSFTISNKDKPKFKIPEFSKLSDYDSFLKEEKQTTIDRIDSLEGLKLAEGMTKELIFELDNLVKLDSKLDYYIFNRVKDEPIEFIFDWKNHGKYQSVTFRPIYVGDFVINSLFPKGDKILMMSATVLDKEMFCKEVGLNPDEVYMVRMDSTFPVGNRPIFKKYAGVMSYKKIDDTLPKIIEVIEEILEKFPNRKGIVQTHSEKIASYIQNNLFDPRLTFNKDYKSAMDMLDAHKRKDNSVIVASGLREGLDLTGDLSKFQIFCKIPYPSLGDKRVKRRLELDPEWYGFQTSLMFVQALGRSVRSSKERAVTYILDSGFGYFYTRNKIFIPKYIKEAIIW